MLQSSQIPIFPLGNFNQLFFLIFRLWKVSKVLFLSDSISDVHDGRSSLHQRLCSPQLRLLLRKPSGRNTNCCLWLVTFSSIRLGFFCLKGGSSQGKAGRTNCGINFYLLPASLQTVCFHWTWQLTIFAWSLLSAFQEHGKKCRLLSTRHDDP